MKLVHSNGRYLIVRDVGEVLIRLKAEDKIPLPLIQYEILPDEEARLLIKDLLATDRYSRV